MKRVMCVAAAILTALGGAAVASGKAKKPAKPKRPPAPVKAAPGDPLLEVKGGATPDQWALRAIGFEPKPDPTLQPVVVAVIDTGLDYLHEDLAPESIWRNEREKLNGIDDDGDGRVDDLIGWNFVEDDNNPWDPVGHGTHVAGIIAAATGNRAGIAGMNSAARILPLRALNAAGHGRSSQIAAAIYYAASHGARVINLSLGGESISDAERRAVAYAARQGAVIVVPAGNGASSTEAFGLAALPGVITVAATDRQDRRASFSSFGPQVKLAAPGVDVLSLRARGTDLLAVSEAPDYRAASAVVAERYYAASGTSFATAFVSGLASLLIARNPALTPAQVERILLHSARDVDAPGVDQRTGYGRIDLKAAFAADPAFFVEARITAVEVVRGDAGARLKVRGTVDADVFAGAYLEVAPGDAPPEPAPAAEAPAAGEAGELAAAEAAPSPWREAVPSFASPVRDAEIADLDASSLGPGVWTLRLVAVHENGRQREARAVIELEGGDAR
jgi:subtilisin family serine protease